MRSTQGPVARPVPGIHGPPMDTTRRIDSRASWYPWWPWVAILWSASSSTKKGCFYVADRQDTSHDLQTERRAMIFGEVVGPRCLRTPQAPYRPVKAKYKVPLPGKVERSGFEWSTEKCVVVCACRRSGDGLWWRPTRSRNSRPELIADDGQGMFFPVCRIPWQRPDRRAGHAPGVNRRNDTSDR